MSDEITQPAIPELTEWEFEQFSKWRRSKDTAPLALSTALKMYEMFLLGHSCEEIFRANDQKFPLGMILDARIRYGWDKRRAAYLDQLFGEVGVAVKQRQVEGAMFLGDVLAAAHLQFGDKVKKFLQTKDPNDLPDALKVTSITTYKMVVDALMKVTGQENQRGGAPGPAVQVIGNNVTLQEAPKKKLGSSQAFDLLKELEKIDQESRNV